MTHNRQSLLRQFRQPEDKIAFAKVLDQVAFCAKNHEPAFTEFLDPHRAGIMLAALGDMRAEGLQVSAFGGYDEAERVMLGFWQEYITPSNDDFPIAPIRLRYDAKYAQGLTHRDFLGATLGTGITRALVGDIAVMASQTILFVHTDIADYLTGALDKIGRLRVTAEPCPPEELFVYQLARIEERITVASLRLDVVAGALFRMSRSQIGDLIDGEKVLINWMTAKATAQMKAGDMITVRGTGRAKITEILGETKKERIVISCERYARK